MAGLTTDVDISLMEPGDWPGVAAVYAEGIASGAATFETEVPSWERWDRDHLAEGRLVARAGGEVVGWAALSRVPIRDGGLPRERGQRRDAQGLRLPRGRAPEAPGAARGPLARRAPARAPEPRAVSGAG